MNNIDTSEYNRQGVRSMLLGCGIIGIPLCALVATGYFIYHNFKNKIDRQPDLTQPNIMLLTPTPSVTPTSTLAIKMLPVECVDFSRNHKLITIIVNGQVTQVPEGKIVEICGQLIQAIETPTPNR